MFVCLFFAYSLAPSVLLSISLSLSHSLMLSPSSHTLALLSLSSSLTLFSPSSHTLARLSLSSSLTLFSPSSHTPDLSLLPSLSLSSSLPACVFVHEFRLFPCICLIVHLHVCCPSAHIVCCVGACMREFMRTLYGCGLRAHVQCAL